MFVWTMSAYPYWINTFRLRRMRCTQRCFVPRVQIRGLSRLQEVCLLQGVSSPSVQAPQYLKACGLFTHDYEKHHCPYCNYYNCDITNMHEHMKFHFTEAQHVCRHGCGMRFARPSAEITHSRLVHNDYGGMTSHQLRRAGRRVVRFCKSVRR